MEDNSNELLQDLQERMKESELELGGDDDDMVDDEGAESEADQDDDDLETDPDEIDNDDDDEAVAPQTVKDVLETLPDAHREFMETQMVKPLVEYLNILQLAETKEGRAKLRADLDARDREEGVNFGVPAIDLSKYDEADQELLKPFADLISGMQKELQEIKGTVQSATQRDRVRESAIAAAPAIVRDMKRSRGLDMKQSEVVKIIMDRPDLKPEEAVLLAVAKKPAPPERKKATPQIKDAGGTGNRRIDYSKMSELEILQAKMKESERRK